MDFLFIIVIIFILFVYLLSTPKTKGAIGELRIAGKLNNLQYEEYRVFNDVLISTGRGSTQIDHLVISIYGIFVIETKNYSGWIHGGENSEYWTQTIYKEKTKFRNPIKQNLAHIYALKEILKDFGQIAYHPIVVFAGSAKLKNIYSTTPVIYRHQLIQTIMDKSVMPNLSIAQVEKIIDILDGVSIQHNQAKYEHIQQVQNHVNERKEKERSLVCPRCGGDLVARVGPYGKFYGCSNYPKCRYKINNEE